MKYAEPRTQFSENTQIGLEVVLSAYVAKEVYSTVIGIIIDAAAKTVYAP